LTLPIHHIVAPDDKARIDPGMECDFNLAFRRAPTPLFRRGGLDWACSPTNLSIAN
jgi:hypothetical protein